MTHKDLIKEYIPPVMLRKLTGLFYGWSGNYSSWEEAKKHSTGYDAASILNRVKDALLKVKNGETAAERDSIVFDKIIYSFPVLSALLWIAHHNNGEIRLVDFGGSLGSSYFQNKKFLEPLKKVSWNIVEQKHFVDCGKQHFQNEQLQFFESIEDCLKLQQADTILLSSVLQYIEKPYELLDYIIQQKFSYIIIDRTPFLLKGKDRITIQKVHPKIYKATYPCWFFNKEKFIRHFSEYYDLIAEFDSLDKANIRSEFKGFLFTLKNKY